MNTKATLLLIGSLCFSAPLLAGDNRFDELVSGSGLSKQDVRMLIGAHTPYPAYRVGFERKRAQLIKSIGRERYDELVAALRAEAADSAKG